MIPKSREGDTGAREQLLSELQSYLEYIAQQNLHGQLKQKMGTSDVVQLAFLRVVENFEKFKGGSRGEFQNWLKTIVINEIKNARRSYTTGKRDLSREKSLDETSTGTSDRAVDSNLTPSSDAMAAERRQRFRQVMQELSVEHSEVIQLRSIDELSFKEIGERMNRSEDAVSKLWYRAMLKLEEKLKSCGNFESQ